MGHVAGALMLGAVVFTQALELGLQSCPLGQVTHTLPFQLPGMMVRVSVSASVLPSAWVVQPSVTLQVSPAVIPVVLIVLELA